jgi:hypothetical protein
MLSLLQAIKATEEVGGLGDRLEYLAKETPYEDKSQPIEADTSRINGSNTDAVQSRNKSIQVRTTEPHVEYHEMVRRHRQDRRGVLQPL